MINLLKLSEHHKELLYDAFAKKHDRNKKRHMHRHRTTKSIPQFQIFNSPEQQSKPNWVKPDTMLTNLIPIN